MAKKRNRRKTNSRTAQKNARANAQNNAQNNARANAQNNARANAQNNARANARANAQNGAAAAPAPRKPPVLRKPPTPVFWIAAVVPFICLVGAWTYPPVATPMELKSYASQIYLSVLLVIWLWMQRRSPEQALTFSPARISFALLFLVGTLSLLWAENPDFWVYKWNKWYAGLAIFLLALHIEQNEKNLETILNLAIIGGVATAVLGIAQYLFVIDVIPQTAFPSSTFGNGNMAGHVVVLTAPLPLYFLFKRGLPSGRAWLYALAISCLLVYAFYTRTRAVWVSVGAEVLLVSLFVYFDRARRAGWLHWNREKALASITGLAAFLTLANFDSDGFRPFWEIAIYEISSIAQYAAASAEQVQGVRYLLWGVSFDMMKESPLLGTGLGSFYDGYNNHGYSSDFFWVAAAQRVHNDVIELGVELGALGLAALLGVIVTMCVVLYKLMLGTDGHLRKLFFLLTVAVAGSMANAQLSFPYQLPVPLVIMPFFVALIIRGAENLDGNLIKVPIKPWFRNAAVAGAGCVCVFIVINDLAWMRDIDRLNKMVDNRTTDSYWAPQNPIYNQAYISAGRAVRRELHKIHEPEMAQVVMQPIVEYWPDVAINMSMAAEDQVELSNFDLAEKYATRTLVLQPRAAYLGERQLVRIYLLDRRMDDLRHLYEDMKDASAGDLTRHQKTLGMMHSVSLALQDYEMTAHYFEQFVDRFGYNYAPVVANQAIYLMRVGNLPEAIPLMKRALELDDKLDVGDRFRQIIAKNPEL